MSEPVSLQPLISAGEGVYAPHPSTVRHIPEVEPVQASSLQKEASMENQTDGSAQSVSEKITMLNKMLETHNLKVRFEVDTSIVGNLRIVMYDKDNRVVREIPPGKAKSLLSKVKKSDDSLSDLGGFLVDSKA